MAETRVVNLRREPFDVYIGRAGRGQDGYFGNPFRREDPRCLEKFEDYFRERVDRDPEFNRRVSELRGLTLGCFCKPGKCHGDILAAWADSSGAEQPPEPALCACGNPAKYLCDAPRPFTKAEMLARFKAGEKINGHAATCDAPLCDSCREPPGMIASCGRGRGCLVDSIDRCRKCAVKAALA